MNKTTLEIAKYITSHYGTCDLNRAAKIQSQMICDFSSCTTLELHREIDMYLESQIVEVN